MRRALSLSIAVALVASALAGVVQARTHTHDPAKVRVTIPSSWKVELEDDGLSAETKDGLVLLMFEVVEASQLDQAIKELDDVLEALVRRPKIGDAEEVVINGMPGAIIEAEGRIDGVEVEVGVMLLDTPAEKVLMVLGMGTPDALDKHQKAIDGIFDSLSPVATPGWSATKKGWSYYPHAKAKVEISLPDKWRIDTREDSISAESKDGAVMMLFEILRASEVDTVLDELDKELADIVDKPKVGKAENLHVNGMDGVGIEAVGYVDGVKVELGLALLETPAKKVLMVLGVAEKKLYGRHEKTIDDIVTSIRPLK